MVRPFRAVALLIAAVLSTVIASAARPQDDAALFDRIDHPAIGYRTAQPSDPVTAMAQRLANGSLTLAYDDDTGYLPALLKALDVPVDSQLALYSKTSLQQPIISPANPRVVYFSDTVTVAWPRGGFIEIAAEDPTLGVVFYVLPQQPIGTPTLMRRDDCLVCHHSYNTLGVPGLLSRSVVTSSQGDTMPYLGNYVVDDRSPLEERWAGWFVTGSSGRGRHLGNQMPPLTRNANTEVTAGATSVAAFPEALRGYLSPRSDIVAHLVLEHQIRVTNLLTRAGWWVRLTDAEKGDVDGVAAREARELVDALLFVDEANLPPGIEGDARFATGFTARGPLDSQGRSLRQFDLRTRLMRYPCSFMIYADAFDALPRQALDAVYRRLWAVLSGDEKASRYARLTPGDRDAIIDILRDTKKGLPEYFRRARP